MFVKVRTDILNELSKLMLSNNKTPDKINKLIKKEINTKKDSLIFSLSIFLSEYSIYWLKILLGFTNLIISIKEDFIRI